MFALHVKLTLCYWLQSGYSAENNNSSVSKMCHRLASRWLIVTYAFVRFL